MITLRLIWKKSVYDFNGKFCNYEYKTDIIELPSNAQAYQFPDCKLHGWLPELVGGEWIIEKD